MAHLSHDLSPLLSIRLAPGALDGLEWRDFGDGASLAKLAREGETGLVLYRVAADAPQSTFAAHRHIGGEAYFMLKGVIADETGRYSAGSFVWLPPGSSHAPWAIGDTVVLVFWPEGVEMEG